MQRFAPGMIDYNGPMAAHYPAGRALSTSAAQTWRMAVEPFIPKKSGLTILDLGSGTGRFSTFLANAFGARVIGVEPARGMRTLAAQAQLAANVAFLAGTAENIPLRDESCDVVWMSQVLHHIRDHARCAGELRRVIQVNGRVLLRGTYAEGQGGFPTLLRFFPGVAEVFKDLPRIDATIDTFEAQGLTLDTHRKVEQQTCGSLRELAERTRLRADSSLALLSDDEFETCQAALEYAASHERDPEPVLETLDLLVLRVAAGAHTA